MAKHDSSDSDPGRAAGAALVAGGVFGAIALGWLLLSRKNAPPAEKPGEMYVHQTTPPPPSIPWHQPGWTPPPDPKGPFKPHA
jgi:hypothetical protein